MTETRASLLLTADASGLSGEVRSAAGELDKLKNSAKSAGDGMSSLASNSDRASSVAARLENSFGGFDRQIKSAAVSADAFDRALKAEAQSFKQLQAALDPSIRAAREFEAAQKQINNAVKLGVASNEEAARSMQLLEARYGAFGKAAGASGRSAQGFGGGIQNASYQVADLAVQIEMGTHWTRALGQQLPQLLGGFGAVGAVLGALVALSPFVISMFTDIGKNSQTLEDQLSDLAKTTDLYSDAAKEAKRSVRELRDEFGDMADTIAVNNAALLKFASVQAQSALLETADRFGTQFGGFDNTLELGAVFAGMASVSEFETTITRLSRRFKITREEAEDLAVALQNITLAESGEEIEKAGGALVDLMVKIAGSTENANAKFGELVLGKAGINALMEEARKSIRGVRDEIEALTASYDTNLKNSYKLYSKSRSQFGQTSGSAVDLIKEFEGFEPKAYWDVNAYRAGFGSDTIELSDGTVRKITQGMSVSLEDANRDLLRRVGEFQSGIIDRIGQDRFDSFTREQQAALTSIAYNYGSLPERIIDAVRSGTSDDIANAIGRLSGDNGGINASRRFKEASAFGGAAVAHQEFNEQKQLAAEQERATKEAEREAGRAQKKAEQDAKRHTQEMERLVKERARDHERAVADINRAMDNIAPSYARDSASAEAWRAEALAGLDETKAGFEAFAADVEIIYNDRLQKAYDAELKRRTDWQAGIERGLKEVESDLIEWADVSENLVTNWSKGMEDAFVRLVKTGKFEIGDLVDFTLEQFARLAFQQAIMPGLNGVLGSLAGAFGGVFGGGSSVPTHHTGSPGTIKTYNLGGFGDRPRSNERLTMVRDGEQIFTSRALENAGGLIAALAGMAGREPAHMQTALNITINNRASQAQVETRKTESGVEINIFDVIEGKMASKIASGRGPLADAMQSTFGVSRRFEARR